MSRFYHKITLLCVISVPQAQTTRHLDNSTKDASIVGYDSDGVG